MNFEVGNKVLHATLSPLEKRGLLDKFGRMVTKRLPNIVRVNPLSSRAEAKFLDLTKEKGVPEKVVGHFSYLDPVVGSDLSKLLLDIAKANALASNLTGFVATLSKTVLTGHQSEFLRGIYGPMEFYARERGTIFLPITRDRDVIRYGLEKDPQETENLKALLKQPGMGTMVLAGGSVQPGRHAKWWHLGDRVNGLQRLDPRDKDIMTIYKVMTWCGRENDQRPYFLPVGINGTYRFLSSDSIFPTPEGVISISDILSTIFGLVKIKRMNIDIRVGEPLTDEDMVQNLGTNWRKNSLEVNDFLLGRVALLLPPNARGDFAKQSLLRPAA